MVQIDLAEVTVRQANELIRKYGAQGENIDVVNPDARHHIGVGLTDAVTVRVHGSAGYFCAGLTDSARFEVESNVGWGLGDNMYSGSVVIGGNASAIAGVAIRGAEIIIRGNMGSRAGQVMKAGTLLCGGNALLLVRFLRCVPASVAPSPWFADVRGPVLVREAFHWESDSTFPTLPQISLAFVS